MSDVVQLRSTPPLFKAYEEIYSSMESKYCPSFFKSEEVSHTLGTIHYKITVFKNQNSVIWGMSQQLMTKVLPFFFDQTILCMYCTYNRLWSESERHIQGEFPPDSTHK